MEKLKKIEAVTHAKAAFGDFRSWSRAQYLAYGLIRGVPYSVMERCSNDAPPWGSVACALAQLGAWPDVTAPKGQPAWRIVIPQERRQEVDALIVWVRKTPRGKRVRVSNGAPVRAEVAE